MDEEWVQDSNAAIEAIFDEYPEARPFASLVTSETVEGYRDVVREIASRVRGMQKGSASQPSPSPRNPKPASDKPVSVQEAISARSWPDYLSSAWERQNENADRD